MTNKETLQELRAMQVCIKKEVEALHEEVEFRFEQILKHSFEVEKLLIAGFKKEDS